MRIFASLIPLAMILILYRRISTVGNLSIVLLVGVLAGCFWIIGSGIPHLSASRVFDFPPGRMAT